MSKNKWKPQPGQTDFTNIRWAPVINCVVRYKGKILLVQRDGALNFYPGYWNGISGFLDDDKSLREKVREEIREELGLSKKVIKQITLGKIFDQEAPKYKKTWIVHPVLVEVTTDAIKLDREARSFQWLTPKAVRKLKLLPGFADVLKALAII
jgi:ADP-ribose pyrophosphatase YjhB (NUDIX family)